MDRFRAGVKEFFSCAVPVDENEIVDENHKPELNYSVGEDESEFDVPYSLLTKDEKTERMEYLWYRCYLKANGAAKIYHRFAEVHRNILIFGTTKNINYDPTKADREAFLNKKPWILLPES